MKALLAIVVLVSVTGCDSGVINDLVKGSQSDWSEQVRNRNTPVEQLIKGHTYLLYESPAYVGYNLAVVHAAHCPCQDTTKGTTK